MRDFVLLLVLVIAVGGLVLWASRADFSHMFESTASAPVQVQEPQPVAAKTPAPKAKKAVKKADPEVAPASTPVAASAALTVPAQASLVKAAPAPPRPFPSVEEISVGAEEMRITDEFGIPALAATTSREGHVAEMLVYSKDRGRAVTVINLEDGKVSSAYSRSGVIPMVGTPVPRRQTGS